MKRFYKLLAVLVAVIIAVSALPINSFAGDSNAPIDYIEFIDFGPTYANGNVTWHYYTSTYTTHANEQMIFKGTNNAGTSFGNRAVLLSNNRTVQLIEPGKQYEVMFELWLQGETLASKTVDIRFDNYLWSTANPTVAYKDTADKLKLINTRSSGNYTIYTLSATVTSSLSANTNLCLSVYGNGSAKDCIIDNIYIYENVLKDYQIYDEEDNLIAVHTATPGASIADNIKGTDLDKFGFDFKVTPETYPEDETEKIVVKYTKHENLVTDIDFNAKYASTNRDKYLPEATTHIFLNSTNVKFLDTCRKDVDFIDRAVLLSNDYSKSSVEAGTKYRLAFKVITWSSIDAYTLQIRYGSDYTQSYLANGVDFDGDTLKENVVSQTTNPDGSTEYFFEVEIETPSTGWDSSVKNLLVSFYTEDTYLLLDNVSIRKYLTYNVEDTNGKSLGTLTAFPGDKVSDYLSGFYIEDYKCEPVNEIIPLVSSEKIVLKYTEITNVLQFIDFSSSYCGGNPTWHYYTSAYVKYENEQMSFNATNNSGTSFGNRAVLLANNRSEKLIKAGKRYELQFELWLQGETLASKTVDIRFDNYLWSSSNPVVARKETADKFTVVNTKTSGAYTIYTLSTFITSTTDTNICISIHGTGSGNASIIDNVYILEEFEYQCVDGDGNSVGTITAFPGENLLDRITGSAADKLGYFETVEPKTAPAKPTTKVVVNYTLDASYVAFIDFGSSYCGGNPTWHYYTSTHTTYSNGQMSFKGTNNANQDYANRAVLLSNNRSTKSIEANKRYLIQFELWLKGEELSSKTVDIRIDDYVWKTAKPDVTYKNTADKLNLVSKKTSGEYTVYTLSVEVVANKAGNFLISVHGNGSSNAAIIDNVEISKVSKITFANTDTEAVVGKIGYSLSLPTNVLKKGYVFDGWYSDSELTNKLTLNKFPENDVTIYASFTKVVTEASMNFNVVVPANANLTGFDYSMINGNISASTDATGVAYFNMYSDSQLIRISPASYYPVYFKYKTSDYKGKITFGIVSASKDDFNTAQNVIAVTTVDAKSDWTTASMCATPDIITQAGEKGEYLYFFVRFEGSKKGKIYVDDVELRQETSFSFDTNGGNAISSIKGEPGTSATLPVPANGDKVFSGWFYDAALTSKVANLNTIYPTGSCNIKLYAGWDLSASDIYVEDFESYNQSLIDDAANVKAQEVFKVSSAFAYVGNTSMHYKYDPEISKLLSATESTFKLTDNSVAAGNAMKIESGKKYIMTFYVYAKALNSKVEIQLATALGNDIGKNYKLQTTAVGAARISNVFYEENKWHKVQYAFTGTTATAAANELFLSIRTTSSVYTELYIDNITIQEIKDDMAVVAFDDSLYNNSLADIEYSYILGKEGETVKYPQIARSNHKVISWHTAYNYKVLFTDVFAAGLKTAFVQYDIDGIVTVDFENTGHYSQDGTGTNNPSKFTLTCGSKIVVGEKASKGSAAIKCSSDNKYWNGSTMNIALKDVDATALRLVDNTTYIISVDVYVEKSTSDFSFWFSTGSQDNYFAWQGNTSGKMIVNQDVERGKWITTTLTYSTAFSEPGGFNLFLNSTCPKGTTVYYDNIRIESIKSSEVVVIMNSGLIGGSTQRISGKIGEEYTLPTKLNIPNYEFVGWYNSPSLDRQVDYEDFFVNTRTVYAKLVPSVVRQDFENLTDRFHLNIGGDMDYEYYNDTKADFNAANVHSGVQSLHRKGNDYLFKNALIVTKSAQLSPGEVYEVTMWVKLNSAATKNGALKIGSCSSNQFAWDLTDDMKAVVAISDLTDKKWHKVTFKFMASAYYLAIQTPGYCDMFIDDITIKYLGAAIPSDEVEYTEYVPIKKDANGNIPSISVDDVLDINDSKLEIYEHLNELMELYGDYDETTTKTKKKTTSVSRVRNPLTFMDIVTGNSFVWYTVVFYCGVGVIVAAAFVITLITIKKKKGGNK